MHDASAKSEGGLYLKDALEKGPNLLPLLWGILLRNVCLFLWLNPQGDIEVYSYKKVFFGAKSSQLLLQVVLKQHLESFINESEMASQLLRNLCMDDPVNSMVTTEKAREFWHEAVRIFQDGGFNLRKFRSNDEDLLHIADSESCCFEVPGTRLLNSLRLEFNDVLEIDDEFLWTDSSVSLAWINQGPCVGGVFVANRVEEFTAVGGVSAWVPTNENPADLPTRGMTVAQLSDATIW